MEGSQEGPAMAAFRNGNESGTHPTIAATVRIASNIRGLPETAGDVTILENRQLDLGSGRVQDFGPILRAFWSSRRCDAMVIQQAQRALLLLCLLRLLLPVSRSRLVSVDLLLTKPEPGFRGWIRNHIMRLLLRRIDLFLLYQRDTAGFRTYYGVPEWKCRYVPFKVNALETLAMLRVPEGDYILSAGRSYRDFPTLCDAVAKLSYPTVILTPEANEAALHGTSFQAGHVPPHVQVVHDDGSASSWMNFLVNAKIMVLTVSPEAIFPAGVGTINQAMALGKCVIVTESYATRGILEHEREVIVVPMQDPAALREAIRKAWEVDEYRRPIARRGRTYALGLGGEDTLMANIAQAVVDCIGVLESRTA
jgi:glycosyltransferase involved in cell wall biosynthesis